MSALQDQRTALLVGDEGVDKLKCARVAVFGLGGVGSAAAEALVRAGVGTLVLVDNDVVSESNINRQLIALHSTVGKKKAQVMADRARDIRPDVQLDIRPVYFSAETAGEFDFPNYDYVIDAIDTVGAKVELICRATAAGTPIISCMGAGNKLDPTRFSVTDLSKTQMCPLARVMRQRLRQKGIVHLPVVWSDEPAQTPRETIREGGRLQLPGSIAFVPPAAGYAAAGAVIRALLARE